MKIAVLATGDELATGELVDTNSAWFSQLLFGRGVRVEKHVTVGDDRDALFTALDSLASEMDVVVTSGGLGPTEDDLTVEVVATLLQTSVSLHQESLDRAMKFFERAGLEFTQNNRKQALVPDQTRVFINPEGLAPAFSFLRKSCTFYCLPGVPREFKALCEQFVLPEIMAATPGSDRIAHRVLRLAEVPESHLALALRPVMDAYKDVRFGFRAHYPEIWFKFAVQSEHAGDRLARLDEITLRVTEIMGDRVFGQDDQSLERTVVDRLTSLGLTVATAESCSGGLVGKLLTDVPGSSACFVGGVVCYSNTAKTTLLGVSQDILDNHGAISEACARAMAEGAKRLYGTDLAVSVTGIAGPDGGSPDKPVGTVHFALASPSATIHQQRRFRRGREAVRSAAAVVALNTVRLWVEAERRI